LPHEHEQVPYIRILSEQGPISVCAYCCPLNQKKEIEKQVGKCCKLI
jgi:hypothetical protein